MATLYDLTADYMALISMAEDPDIDEQAFLDTLEGIEGALEDKAENYAKVMRMLDADEAAYDEEAKFFARKAKAAHNAKRRMKESLQYAMEATGKTKFKTALFTFALQKNAPSVIIDEPYIENLPERFLVPQDPKINKVAIKDAIKNGEDLTGVAHLEQTQSLRIR